MKIAIFFQKANMFLLPFEITGSSPILLAVTAACVGGLFDLKTRKIPNRFTFAAMAVGLAINGILKGLLGIGAGFLAFFLFAIGGLKAGDVKLYMAVGALAGWKFCLNTMAWSLLLGGAAGFVLLVVRKTGRQTLKNLWDYFISLFYLRRFYMYTPKNSSSYFSFGCFIAAGTLAAWLYPLL